MIDLSGAVWRKSIRSNNGGACVEVAKTPHTVRVRDSKNPSGGMLVLTPDQWRAFIDAVKRGEFDA